MANAVLRAIGVGLPEKILTTEDLAQAFPECAMGKIGAKLGIRSRHVMTEERTIDVAIQASKALFAKEPLCRASIDFVLYCTQSPEYPLPTTACLIQEALGLPTTCGALDYNLGCSGYVYGLALAKGLVAGGIAQNVLLITAERYSQYIAPEDYGNRAIFGDGATASWISNEGDGLVIGEFVLGTDGKGAENLIVHPQKPLYMDGPEILSFTLERVPKIAEIILQKNICTFGDVSLWVLHQANAYILEFLRKKLKVPHERFYYALEDVGNTVSSSIPIALERAQREGLWSGQVLLLGFGVGYSWGGTILTAGGTDA